MTEPTTVVDYVARRILVALPDAYDEARARYEQLVPIVDLEACSSAGSWAAVLAAVEVQAPNGFMRYYRGDVTSVVAGSPSRWKATQYLMGNHTIAETMFRHDPSVMVYAPLRTLIYEDPAGRTRPDAPGWPSTSPACSSPASVTPGSPRSASVSTLSCRG
uniref:DUF302 domain-containing protein n=2 Tax=unclassified Mycobacterium TaxID=2642494 RepID=A0A5Q5BS70_MYCSS